MKKATVLIADDHAVVRMGLTSLINSMRRFDVIGEASNGEEAVARALKLAPDIVIMDLMMPKKDGASATAEILSRRPECKILILTTFGSFTGIAHALAFGAVGALLKNIENDDLLHALERIAAGEKGVISPEIRRLMKDDPPPPELSPRQQEALDLIVKGKTNAEIADFLHIREDSVKKIIITTFDKIGATNRAEAVAIALRKHLLKI